MQIRLEIKSNVGLLLDMFSSCKVQQYRGTLVDTIALSSTEAEFMSMVAAIQEALWLKRFEKEIFPNAGYSFGSQ